MFSTAETKWLILVIIECIVLDIFHVYYLKCYKDVIKVSIVPAQRMCYPLVAIFKIKCYKNICYDTKKN